MKTLTISDSSFETLRRWASVGRTIDAAVNAIFDGELAQELIDLKDALDDCGRAAKSERFIQREYGRTRISDLRTLFSETIFKPMMENNLLNPVTPACNKFYNKLTDVIREEM